MIMHGVCVVVLLFFVMCVFVCVCACLMRLCVSFEIRCVAARYVFVCVVCVLVVF